MSALGLSLGVIRGQKSVAVVLVVECGHDDGLAGKPVPLIAEFLSPRS